MITSARPISQHLTSSRLNQPEGISKTDLVADTASPQILEAHPTMPVEHHLAIKGVKKVLQTIYQMVSSPTFDKITPMAMHTLKRLDITEQQMSNTKTTATYGV